MMKLLFIGGTRFLGRHLVNAALQAGHEVTLFNRGQTNPDLFPQVEHILGDRDSDLDRLSTGKWEAVIDTCGYTPKQVHASAQILVDRVEHYTFISTISVYADFSQPGLSENALLATMDEADADEFNMENYGPLKVLCEAALEEFFPQSAFIPRPGLIVGPHDTTDRFTYWIRRCLMNAPFLAPGPGDQRVQLIDVRDLATWIIEGIQHKLSGAFNATGPATMLSFKRMLDACIKGTRSQSEPLWADTDFLLDGEVEPWSDLPLWVADEETQGMLAADCSKAISAGLTFRPLAETAADLAAWDRERQIPPLKAGLSPDREKVLIDHWREQAG
jgi:2'-hydroxyisoflavone reductase